MRPPESFIEIARKTVARRLPPSFKRSIAAASLNILFELYVAKMLFYSMLAAAVSFAYSVFMLMFLGTTIFAALLLSVCVAAIIAAVVFGLFYLNPYFVLSSKRKSIETNLPFAANHMGALAASGVPPHTIFKLIADAKEYGEIANESRRIVRNIDVFGMDMTTAARQVAARTPSSEFRQFLSGMIATISTGGDLREHMKLAAKDALSGYRVKRQRYAASLSTYADFYVGVLIAAPLFFISILSLLAIIGGELIGMPIDVLLNLGIYVVLPVLNIAFIIFVHMTQPPM